MKDSAELNVISEGVCEEDREKGKWETLKRENMKLGTAEKGNGTWTLGGRLLVTYKLRECRGSTAWEARGSELCLGGCERAPGAAGPGAWGQGRPSRARGGGKVAGRRGRCALRLVTSLQVSER